MWGLCRSRSPYSCCGGGGQQSSLSRHATFSSSQTDVQVRCAYARRHKYATRVWNAQVHKTPSLAVRSPRVRDVRHPGSNRSPDVHGSLRCLTFCRRCLSSVSFSSSTISHPSNCNSGRPLELLQLSLIAERSLSPSPSRKQSPLPVCASQPRSCASSLVASRSRRPRKARRTTATTGTGGDGATVSGPLARRNVPTVSITASLGSGTCG